MLNILHKKGHVSRTLVGRSFQYRASQTRDSAQKSGVRDLLKTMFGGSVEKLVVSLVRNRQIDGTKLIELAKCVTEDERSFYTDRI